MRAIIACGLLCVLAPAAARAQDASRAVDELFRQWDNTRSPGAAVLVLHRGERVHARGYGMADLEHGVPITTSTVFDIASVSKQFGAFAIALLEADGLLSLDDDVRKYLPELHDFGRTITVRHLVHHTSGIRDWPGTLRIGGWSYQDVLSFDQILRMAFQQRELNFEPGSAYAYSNTGYNLLAEIVRRVSGQSFREFTDARIFRPLGMHDSHFHDDHTMIVPNRAESYTRGRDGACRNVPNNLTALGSSSLFTTVDDLGRWVINFDSATVGGAGVVGRTHARGVLNSGDTIAYAFGQSIGTYRGARVVSHTGSWAGYRTVLQRYPDNDFAVVILANTSDMNTNVLGQRIADIYLRDVLAPPVVSSGGAGEETTRRTWSPTPAQLSEYAGTYVSAELSTAWTLSVRDGQLVASHFRVGDIPLQPVERDRFQSGLFGEVRFQRERGRVVSFTANSDRVRGLKFTKEGM